MSNKTTYRTICEQHPEILVFAQAWWLDVVCAEWDAAIAMKGEHVKGVWAYPVEQKLGIGLIRSPKLTPYLGPQVFYPPDMKESNKDSYEHETIAELIKQLPAVPVWNLAIQPGIKQAGLFRNYGLTIQTQQTFIIDLRSDEDTLFATFKDTTRRNIRQAEKECTLTNEPDKIPLLFEFHKQTLTTKNKGIVHNVNDLQQLIKSSVDNNCGEVWVARQGERIEGIAWYVWDRNSCYSIMTAMNPAAESSKAMSLMHWNAIKEAKRKGQKFFDLEGSMDEGVERFFRSFGGIRELYLVLLKNKSLLWRIKQMLS